MPSIESLRAVDPADSAIQVVMVDKVADYDLRQLIDVAIDVSRTCADSKEIATRLAGIVSTKMGSVSNAVAMSYFWCIGSRLEMCTID
jgi:serine/threonine-protein kinase CTR1